METDDRTTGSTGDLITTEQAAQRLDHWRAALNNKSVPPPPPPGPKRKRWLADTAIQLRRWSIEPAPMRARDGQLLWSKSALERAWEKAPGSGNRTRGADRRRKTAEEPPAAAAPTGEV